MDKEIDLFKFGLKVGDKVIVVDDEWSMGARDITVVDVEPVPGSTQCLIKDGEDYRTVSRGELVPA